MWHVVVKVYCGILSILYKIVTVPLPERWRKRVIYKIWYNVSFQHIGTTWSILFLKEMPLTKTIMLNYIECASAAYAQENSKITNM